MALTLTQKLERVRHTPRGSFLVESGTTWAELTGETEAGRANAAPAATYTGPAAPVDRLPQAAQALYADRAVLRLTPTGHVRLG